MQWQRGLATATSLLTEVSGPAARGSMANLSPMSSLLGLGGGFRKSLLFLVDFAWASRVRLPVLILVGFLVFDVRMQLEINVDVEVRQLQADSDSEDSDSSDDEDSSEEEYSPDASP